MMQKYINQFNIKYIYQYIQININNMHLTPPPQIYIF